MLLQRVRGVGRPLHRTEHPSYPRLSGFAHVSVASHSRKLSCRAAHQPPALQTDGCRLSTESATSLPASCPAPCASAPSPIQATSGILSALRQSRTVFFAIAFFAAYSYLSAGVTSTGKFASIAIASPSTSTGFELAIKSGWTGLATGVFHTLCGPDHLAGLTPLSIGRSRLAASALGALWGFGHSTGQLILGIVFVLLKDKFHDLVPALESWAAYIVPATLIAIGTYGIYESCFKAPEEHDDEPTLGLAGGGSVGNAKSTSGGKRAGFATYATGIVHGLQPDALFVVIPALALPTKAAAVIFVSMFVVGTVVSMGAYTLLIGTTSRALIKEQPWLQSHLSTIASSIAICCGLLMLAAGQGLKVPIFS